MLIHLLIVCGYFLNIVAEVSSCNRDYTVAKPEIIAICPFTE